MMKGDIDYEMTLDRHNNPLMAFPGYSIPAHIIFTLFVIIVTMLLTGLLIALAVNDIEVNSTFEYVLFSLSPHQLFICIRYVNRKYEVEHK